MIRIAHLEVKYEKKNAAMAYLPKVLGSGRSLWSHGRQEEEREGREGKLGNHVKTGREERELEVVVLWREQPLIVKRKGRRTRVPRNVHRPVLVSFRLIKSP